MATMVSGIEALRKNDRDKEEQQAAILRLQSEVTQLRGENEQLLEQQRYSGAPGQKARFTLSLRSMIFPIRSSSPIVGVSRVLTDPATSSRGLVGKLVVVVVVVVAAPEGPAVALVVGVTPPKTMKEVHHYPKYKMK